MASLKRNFSASQIDSKQSLASLGTKSVKLTSEPNIKVYTRFRPIPNENYTDTYQVDVVENSITINKPEDIIAKNGGIRKFFFSKVFDPSTTQEEISEHVCIPLIGDLLSNRMSILS